MSADKMEIYHYNTNNDLCNMYIQNTAMRYTKPNAYKMNKITDFNFFFRFSKHYTRYKTVDPL